MNGLILFKSQYGSTEQYAEWLSKDTGLKAIPLDDAETKALKTYDFLVIGSNIKVGHLQAGDWIKKNWDWLRHKKVLLYSVSGAAVDSSDYHELMGDSLPDEIIQAFEYFPLPGRLDKSKLNFFDRIIVFLGSRAVPDEAARDRMKTGFDYVKHDHLQHLKSAVEHLLQAPPT